MSFTKLPGHKSMHSPEKRDLVVPIGGVFGPVIGLIHEYLTGAETARLRAETEAYRQMAVEARRSADEWTRRVNTSSLAIHDVLKESAKTSAEAECLLKSDNMMSPEN